VNIILFGPPGAGKGTQADNISKKLNLHKVSTGELLREEIDSNTNLGVKIKSLMDSGSLVSDDIINNLIINIFSEKKFSNRIIFDGYPRNLSQAKSLDLLVKKHNQKISCVLSLDVDKEIVIKRILGRQVCSNCGLIFNKYFKPSTKDNHECDEKYLNKRSDDYEKVIANRFETYLNITFPILEFYENQNLLHKINGDNQISVIYKEIEAIIASLET